MDFTFDDDQEALRRTVRGVPRRAEPADATCGRWSTTTAASPTTCGDSIVDLGWPALLVPEAHGGLGLGLVDMVVVLEEMGRAAVPRAVLLVGGARDAGRARGSGSTTSSASLAAGATRGTVALDEAGHGDAVDRVRTRAEPQVAAAGG